jgi:hypothetical protein
VGRASVGAAVMNAYRPPNPYRSLDRAGIALGLVSILSAGFMFVDGAFQVIQIGAIGLVVALVLGLLAVAAGLLSEGALMLVSGLGFLLAASFQIAQLAGGSSGFLGGNASTFSLWLALGVGLIAIGMVPRPEAGEETPAAK